MKIYPSIPSHKTSAVGRAPGWQIKLNFDHSGRQLSPVERRKITTGVELSLRLIPWSFRSPAERCIREPKSFGGESFEARPWWSGMTQRSMVWNAHHESSLIDMMKETVDSCITSLFWVLDNVHVLIWPKYYHKCESEVRYHPGALRLSLISANSN